MWSPVRSAAARVAVPVACALHHTAVFPSAWCAPRLLLPLLPRRLPAQHTLRLGARHSSTNATPQPLVLHRQHRRGAATADDPSGAHNKRRTKRRPLLTLTLLGVGAATGYYLFSPDDSNSPATGVQSKEHPFATAKKASKHLDYNAVYRAIAEIMEDEGQDDGSYGPIFARLAWHASGTHSKLDGTGGSNGATMRFAPESEHAANAGLYIARERLEKIKQRFPDISYGDLWTLAGVCAIQEMGGPTIKWRPGRLDVEDGSVCAPDGRLPDAAKKQDHVREIFYRMGFNDQEIVALIGAHALGRCHTDRSGFDGPWTPSPTMFSNDFFVQLLNKTWVPKKWKGPKQFVDKETGELMMLPSDMSLLEDKGFRKYVELYAKDSDRFFRDFGAVFSKLLELGVKFQPGQTEFAFEVVNA